MNFFSTYKDNICSYIDIPTHPPKVGTKNGLFQIFFPNFFSKLENPLCVWGVRPILIKTPITNRELGVAPTNKSSLYGKPNLNGWFLIALDRNTTTAVASTTPEQVNKLFLFFFLR